MTLNSIISRVSFSGNGATTDFAFPYYFLQDEDLVVIQKVTATGVETTKVLTTDYTVAGAEDPAGGTVTMGVAPPTGTTLTIYRAPEQTQDLDLVENDPLPAEELEKRLDKLTMFTQRLADRMDRAVRLTDGFSASFTTTLPETLTAGKALIVSGAGTGLDLATLDESTASVLTTKGDLASYSTVVARLGVGSNGQFLTADSGETTGLKWISTLPVANGGTNLTSYTTGDLIYASSSSALAKRAIGTTGQYLRVSGGLPAWATFALSLNYQAKTANYDLLSTDDVINGDASGGAFNLTLPSASDNPGKVYCITKQGTDFNAITLVGTVDGVANRKLTTPLERWIGVSNGTNWTTLSHETDTEWNTSIAFTLNGCGTLQANSRVRSRRNGDTMYVHGAVGSGTVTGTNLSVELPATHTIDSAKFNGFSGKNRIGWMQYNKSGAGASAAWSESFNGILFYDGSDTAKVYLATQQESSSYTKIAASSFISTGDFFSFEFSIPITDWWV